MGITIKGIIGRNVNSSYSGNRLVKVVSGVDNAVLLSCEIELNFPSRFYKQQTNYEEGVFYSYSDKDGARITVSQGALMAFPEDAYTFPALRLLSTR